MALVPGSYYGIINALTAWYLWDITRPLPWYYRYCWYSMAWWYNSYIHVCIGHHPWAVTSTVLWLTGSRPHCTDWFYGPLTLSLLIQYLLVVVAIIIPYYLTDNRPDYSPIDL